MQVRLGIEPLNITADTLNKNWWGSFWSNVTQDAIPQTLTEIENLPAAIVKPTLTAITEPVGQLAPKLALPVLAVAAVGAVGLVGYFVFRKQIAATIQRHM